MHDFVPIQNGVENSNWFIIAADLAQTQYVLTLFEERNVDDVETLTRLMLALKAAGLPVAAPLAVIDPPQLNTSCLYSVYGDKALQLAPRLVGQHPDIASIAMCTHMGSTLAKLHASFAQLTPTADYTLAQYPWQRAYDQHLPVLNTDDKLLIQAIWQQYADCQLHTDADAQSLPTGLTHGDLFLDNTLWQGEHLTGLLDFTEVCDDYLLMDIAITANDYCTDWQQMSFDQDKLRAFIAGYTQVRALTTTEHSHMRLFLAMAAARFWLLRLDIIQQNTTQDRAGEHVLVKSPQRMRDLAQIHYAQLH